MNIKSWYNGLSEVKNAMYALSSIDMYSYIDTANKLAKDGKWGNPALKKYIELISGKDLSQATVTEMKQAWESLGGTIGNTEYRYLSKWLNRKDNLDFSPISDNEEFNGYHFFGSFNVRDDYVPTIFCDPNKPEGSLLHDENGENEATISPNKIELTNPNSQLIINGTKSRIASTEHYGDRLLYCYEMTEPMFGDIGESVVNADGFVYVALDPIFVETVNTVENKYYVSLTPYGKGELYIYDLCSDNFVVRGKPGLKFSWEVKAKQRGFEPLKLEKQNKEKME